MNDLLKNKRQNFQLEIRRKHLEAVFSLKRKLPSKNASTDYQTIIENKGLPEALVLVMPYVTIPLIDMVKNPLGSQIIAQYFNLKVEWDTLEMALIYVLQMVQIPEEDLSPYLTENNLLTEIIDFLNEVIQQIIKSGIEVKFFQSATNHHEKLCLTLNYLLKIVDYITTDCRRERTDILMNKDTMTNLYKLMSIRIDDTILISYLSLLQKLFSGLNKEKRKAMKNSRIFINPMCHALRCVNYDKLYFILLIVYSFICVGFEEDYINSIFKYEGGVNLVKLLDGPEKIQRQVLRVLNEVSYISISHADLLIQNNNLIEKLSQILDGANLKIANTVLRLFENLIPQVRISDQSLISKIVSFYKHHETQEQAYYTMTWLMQRACQSQLSFIVFQKIPQLIIEYMMDHREKDPLHYGALAFVNLIEQTSDTIYITSTMKANLKQLFRERDDEEDSYRILLSIL